MEYEYRCGAGHITTRVVPVRDWKERIRCRCRRVAEQFFSKAPHSHSGRTIWTATEVHGKKKAASETFAADLEDACLKG